MRAAETSVAFMICTPKICPTPNSQNTPFVRIREPANGVHPRRAASILQSSTVP